MDMNDAWTKRRTRSVPIQRHKPATMEIREFSLQISDNIYILKYYEASSSRQHKQIIKTIELLYNFI